MQARLRIFSLCYMEKTWQREQYNSSRNLCGELFVFFAPLACPVALPPPRRFFFFIFKYLHAFVLDRILASEKNLRSHELSRAISAKTQKFVISLSFRPLIIYLILARVINPLKIKLVCVHQKDKQTKKKNTNFCLLHR